ASDYFRALPPAGRAPASAIDPNTFSQTYFPPEMEVELSIIPEDEAPGLLAESLLLPPIDLTLDGESMESTSVLMLIPVDRGEMLYWREVLKQKTRPLQKASAGLAAKQTPIQALRLLKYPTIPPLALDPSNEIDADWRRALAGIGTGALYYTRRRNLMYKDRPEASTAIAISPDVDEFLFEEAMLKRIEEMGLLSLFNMMMAKASMTATSELVYLLGSDVLMGSLLLMAGAIFEMSVDDKLNRAGVLKTSNRYSGFRFGEGVLALGEAHEKFLENDVILVLAESGKVPEIGRLGRLAGAEELEDIARVLVESGSPGDIDA
ncbi:MAG: hypothetical protein GY859_07335, partial [Desulfobacterales bacterium]|nr:hypothetical protein [Desulfobacterales bacterium]